jgi:hypothetical protein
MIALGLTLWIGIPLYLLFFLFTAPSVLYVILRLLVRLPFLIYHHLHYLTVPHPGETAYRAGMAQRPARRAQQSVRQSAGTRWTNQAAASRGRGA